MLNGQTATDQVYEMNASVQLLSSG